jgi:DnaD/phage-associated family protein
MSRGPAEPGELEFLQALLKRGFVNIPRMLFDYMGDLELDYDDLGKIFAVLSCIGGVTENAFGPHILSRRVNPHDFDQVRRLIHDLEQKDVVRSEEEGDVITFSFIPLFARLRGFWDQYRLEYEQEMPGHGADPAVVAAQRLLGRPLSDREVVDIQDWTVSYGFDVPMVEAIIREGQRQGVTRMSYLNQIARQWYEEGIRTPEEAELYIERYRKAAGKHKAIIQYLGLKRALTGAEQALLDKWTDEWGFGQEVIMRACEEAAGSKNPLQYVNRVLESWREHGVRTVAEVEQLLAEHKRRLSTETNKAPRAAKTPAKSNVLLQREKKDDKYYDYIFKRFGQ